MPVLPRQLFQWEDVEVLARESVQQKCLDTMVLIFELRVSRSRCGRRAVRSVSMRVRAAAEKADSYYGR